MKPIWTPYNPDDCVGDFGWLWLDGPFGHEWVLIYTVGDDPDCAEGVLVDLIGRMDSEGARNAVMATRYAGTPYLSLSQPTAEPGKCDGLEVAIRFGGGASAAHAIGQGERVHEIIEGINAVMLPKETPA